ncbi:energy-coupling factor transporter ATPase [Staphylococcus sp. ACRSN]|uniref:energy-coupling factor transporter ATPase n=1 Tax=Staphylococcus sp. ACRSN TaxID=2918214 RepID=UPI001EF38689|nr:energy-coupling factor transporter ATPase [Staphylococcus sp. ACRSN]MCG7338317.1 energy-coupling factor transporter ATPase [Staphylococcus sp. ACRSN]
MESQDNIIKFNHVSFKYNSDEPLALNDVSFDIPKGKWTSIVGHNGSGKSTIAKLMIGIQKPLEGDIYFDHQRMEPEHLNNLREHIGIVFQNPENQFVGATVEYDVAFGLENHAIEHDVMREIVPKVLKDVDMLDRLDYEPQSLSGGQKQRVAIAGVLALNTKVIVLDEATSMLDPAGRTELLNLIRHLNIEKDVTIISVTHDLSEAADSDQMIVLNEGSIFKIGKPKEVFSHGEELTKIGLDLPFSMRMNQMLREESEYITYEGLLSEL